MIEIKDQYSDVLEVTVVEEGSVLGLCAVSSEDDGRILLHFNLEQAEQIARAVAKFLRNHPDTKAAQAETVTMGKPVELEG